MLENESAVGGALRRVPLAAIVSLALAVFLFVPGCGGTAPEVRGEIARAAEKGAEALAELEARADELEALNARLDEVLALLPEGELADRVGDIKAETVARLAAVRERIPEWEAALAEAETAIAAIDGGEDLPGWLGALQAAAAGGKAIAPVTGPAAPYVATGSTVLGVVASGLAWFFRRRARDAETDAVVAKSAAGGLEEALASVARAIEVAKGAENAVDFNSQATKRTLRALMTPEARARIADVRGS